MNLTSQNILASRMNQAIINTYPEHGVSTMDILCVTVAIFGGYISSIPKLEREEYLENFCTSVRHIWEQEDGKIN